MRSGPCLRLICWLPSFLGQGDEDLGFHGLRLQASLSGINKIHIVRKRLNWQVEMVISIRTRKQHLPWENYNMSNLSINLTSLCESSNRKGKTQWSPSSTLGLRRETRPLPSHSPSPSSGPLLSPALAPSNTPPSALFLVLKQTPTAVAYGALRGECIKSSASSQFECFSSNIKWDQGLTRKL